MLGLIPGNGHPYSWSAIVNGYDPVAMARCPYPVIPQYLGEQPSGSVGMSDVRVTHLWTDDPAEASNVAAAALIPHVVNAPEEVIGQVDAVMIATDDGFDHVRRARPFVEAGLPVFVDKPLATSMEDLTTFVRWRAGGARILSSTGLRYAAALDDCLARLPELGELRWLCGVTCKSWERYGIHLLEPLYRITGPGYESIRLESRRGLEVAHLQHSSGVQVTVPVIADGAPAFGSVQICGTAGYTQFRFGGTYHNFRRQLLTFVDFVRTGRAPFPYAETVELMILLIAGLRSRAAGSQRVEIPPLLQTLNS